MLFEGGEIETCRLNGVGAWAYLLEVMRDPAAARKNPAAFPPWNDARGEPAEAVEALARAA